MTKMKVDVKRQRKAGSPVCNLSDRIALATKNKYGFVTIIMSELFQDCVCLTILTGVYLNIISAGEQKL